MLEVLLLVRPHPLLPVNPMRGEANVDLGSLPPTSRLLACYKHHYIRLNAYSRLYKEDNFCPSKVVNYINGCMGQWISLHQWFLHLQEPHQSFLNLQGPLEQNPCIYGAHHYFYIAPEVTYKNILDLQ